MLFSWGFFGFILLVVLLSASIKINKQWQEAVILRLGKFNRVKKAGLFLKIPFLEGIWQIDTRIRTLDMKEQMVITKDNISVRIDAVLFYKVVDSKMAVIDVEDYEFSVLQYAQATLRSVVGQKELDDILEKRDEIAHDVQNAVDKEVRKWGLDIHSIELQDIILPESMKRAMSRQAEAEREKRGVIIASEGELTASGNLQKASMKLENTRYAFALRQLQTISDVSHDQSNTIIFYPTEGFNPDLFAGMGAKVPKAEFGNDFYDYLRQKKKKK